MGDIIWYNDLIHSNFGDDMVTHESAEALFSCETYELIDIMTEGPGLLFGAFAGHNIEFKVLLPQLQIVVDDFIRIAFHLFHSIF